MSTDLVVQNTELASSTLFGTDNPSEVVERASKVARTLEHVVRSQNLVVRIGQSEHVRVEGWTFLGSMLGVFPVVEWTRPMIHEEETVGWEARVEARTRSGEIVGAAEAECLRSERTWKGRDDYALRSMAQTRAVSKALRLPLGFVMQLAGFNPTPAEEMAVIDAEARPVSDPATGTPFSYGWEEVERAEAAKEKPVLATEKQRRLLFATAKEAGLETAALKALIREHTGQESSAQIPRDKFEAILTAVQVQVPKDPVSA